jgi:threonine dehydratase
MTPSPTPHHDQQRGRAERAARAARHDIAVEPVSLRCPVVHETRLDSARIRAARRMIDPIFLDTPLYRCEALESELGCTVSIKLETANPVRSFKARGTEVVATQLADTGSRAVVCASAGNLGQALAWSGRRRGLDVTVVASRFAPAAKLDRIRALDARLELVDGDFDLARERAAAIARYHGIRLVEDSLDIETCEGAATIGLELVGTVAAAPTFDAVLIALGGGALATGVGHVIKALTPDVEVICVQPLGAPAMTRSWHERRVVTTDSTNTIADGVAGRRPIPAVLADLLLVADDAVLVQEASIITGMRMLLNHAGLVVEPSAALGIAAILENRDRFAGRHVVTILCGSNVNIDAYRRWVGAGPIDGSQ